MREMRESEMREAGSQKSIVRREEGSFSFSVSFRSCFCLRGRLRDRFASFTQSLEQPSFDAVVAWCYPRFLSIDEKSVRLVCASISSFLDTDTNHL